VVDTAGCCSAWPNWNGEAEVEIGSAGFTVEPKLNPLDVAAAVVADCLF